ncbi:hypothetical protein GIB67_016082 [Kingdonia uniflora]|uniref:Uncharacterized protein n=1 Tax=Kingdonia uniflora TaxID=39325 RepID=A0A7J7L1X2_9MAGN|nr:hypothetical protein GIB67_016082 [Kingdonia uniflora]
MRGCLGRLASSSSSHITKQTPICSSAFSTFSSGSGRGRGRGRGPSSSGPPDIPQFSAQTPGKPNIDNANGENPKESFIPSGSGHGRGKPAYTSPPIIPSLSSRVPPGTTSIGRGQTNSSRLESPSIQPKAPISLNREDSVKSTEKTQFRRNAEQEDAPQKSQLSRNVEQKDAPLSQKTRFSRSAKEEGVVPSSIMPGLDVAGRGKPIKNLGTAEERKMPDKEENRHIRPPRPIRGGRVGGLGPQQQQQRQQQRSSPEGGGRTEGGRGRGGYREGGGRSGGGRGRAGFQNRNQENLTDRSILGDNADGERLAKRIGVENMDRLTEAFDDIIRRVLPSPDDEKISEALHLNNMIEYEPEYSMGELDMNPDIDEKPPISLRDAFEKAKPFFLNYVGIQSQEEWEEIMEEMMGKAPKIKELMHKYSGPDRVTAKEQERELDKLAENLHANTHSSVKKFTDRALLSLKVS